MISPVASTLDQIAARLKEINEGTQDTSKLPVVSHEASGLSFRVGPMARADYEAWQNLKTLENLQHETGGGAKNGAPQNRDKSDAFLLCHAAFSESGEKLTAELAKLLLDGPGFGPSTHILCEAAAKENPPRAQLIGEMEILMNATACNLVFWRVVKRCGLDKMLLDRLAGDEEERAFAEKEIGKVESTLVFWEAQLSAEKAAEIMESEIYSHAINSNG